MIPEQAWSAFFFGLLSAVSLVLGAALGLVGKPPQRLVAATMAFGAGALLAALSFELILPAEEHAGFVPVALGAIIGGVGFVVLNEVLNGSGGFLRKQSTTNRYLSERRQEEIADLLDKLSRIAILRALPPQDIQAMIPYIETVEHKAGKEVFVQGEEGDALYLVGLGLVDLLVRESGSTAAGERIAQVGPGEAFGEIALLTGEGRMATAVAATDVTLFKIAKRDFDELLAVSPRLSEATRDLLARNLAALSARSPLPEDDAKRWQQIALRYVESHTLATSSTVARAAAQEYSSSAPMGIFLGLLLDGIPESLVIGMSMIGSAMVSPALIAGLFLSNFPEALSSAAGMRNQGASPKRILGIWTFLMVFTGVGAFLGYTFFLGSSPELIGAFEGAAAGAMLVMIAETALPEAYEHGGWLSGVATLMGFLAAFFVKSFQ